MKYFILVFLTVLCSTAFGQSFTVYDIDLTAFPNIKAKLFAADNTGTQITNLSISDFVLKEDGKIRTITNISCPEPKEPEPISSVLTIDVSVSMEFGGLDIAKVAANAWINMLQLGKSECAVTSFNEFNYLNQDFTTNRTRLLDAVNSLQLDFGTDYDAGLYQPNAGSLQITKNAKHKRIVVFLTDGQPNFEPDINRIVNEAKAQNCAIYSVVIGMDCPQCLKDISSATGAQWYENVNTEEDAQNIYRTILLHVQNSSPCTIEWLSENVCKPAEVDVDVKYIAQNSSVYLNYQIPNSGVSKLTFTPSSIYFKNVALGTTKDTFVVVKAVNNNFSITNVTTTNPAFTVTPSNFVLAKDQSITLTVSYSPIDSSYAYTNFNFENNTCESDYYVTGGFTDYKPKENTLKITHPNGGEKFLVGSDTIITWEGILETDTVQLQLSIDNGLTWNTITESASGLKYNWKNIPKPPSYKCLIKANQYNLGNDSKDSNSKIIWAKNYGGTDDDFAVDIKNTNDGGLIVVGLTQSDDVDVTNFKGFGDYWLVKLDADGVLEWENTFGGSDYDEPTSVYQTNDNGYIIAGFTDSFDGDVIDRNTSSDFDYWIVKVDENGEKQWAKSYGGYSGDHSYSIRQTNDDGYIICGYSNSEELTGFHGNFYSDIWVIKTDVNGEIIWTKFFGGTNEDYGFSIEQTIDGGYVLVGTSYSRDFDFDDNKGGSDIWVVKLSTDGEIEWKKNFGGSQDDMSSDIIQTYEGGYLVAGSSSSSDGDLNDNNGMNDLVLFKLGADGTLEWSKNYGGSEDEKDAKIVQTNDGGYLVSAYSESDDGDVEGNHGYSDYWVLKLNAIGDIEFKKCYGGSWSDVCLAVVQTPDYNFVLAGYSSSFNYDVTSHIGSTDYWVLKITPGNDVIQTDVSDTLFAIIEPEAAAKDIDMGKVLVGSMKDSLVTPFITNIGEFPIRIDSIYFTGNDASAFSQVSIFPPYVIDVKSFKAAELRFIPQRIGIHNAVINIMTQSGKIQYNIRGQGVDADLKVLTKVLDFGKVELGSEKTFVDTAVIKNVSGSYVTVNRVTQLGPDYTQFIIVSGDGSFTLAPDEEREMTIKFKPLQGGRATGQIGFEYNGPASPAKAQLYGIGTGGVVYVPDDSAFAGETKIIKLALDKIDPKGLGELAPNYEATIRFQNTILAPSSDYNWQMIFDSVYVDIAGSIGESSVLAEIPMTAALGTVTETKMEIVKFVLKDSFGAPYEYELDTLPGLFKLLGICKEGGTRLFYPTGKTEFLSIIPNPADNQVKIGFNTIEEGDIFISVISTLGTEIIKNKVGAAPGNKEITMNTSELANGVYYIKLQTPTVNVFEKLIISR